MTLQAGLTTRRITAAGYTVAVLILVSAILTRTSGVPLWPAYGLTAACLTGAFLLAVRQQLLVIEVDAISLWLLAVIFAVFLFNLITATFNNAVQIGTLLRTCVFIYSAVLCLFVVPKVISFDDFLGLVARCSALLVLIGLPTAIIGDYPLFGVTVTPHIYGFTLPAPGFLEGDIQPITSILDNPNVLAVLTGLGFAGGLYELRQAPERHVGWMLVSINAVGAYLSGSRAVVMILVLVSGVFVTHHFLGSKWNAGFITLFLGAVLIVLTAGAGVSAIPGVVPRVDIGSREHLWTAAWRAIESRPLLGFGLGDRQAVLELFVTDGKKIQTTHNSYLRMALTTGLLGGAAYVLLFLRAGYRATFVSQNVGLTSVIALITLHQLFGAYSIFGLALNSVLAAIFLGYAISGSGTNVTSFQDEPQNRHGDKC